MHGGETTGGDAVLKRGKRGKPRANEIRNPRAEIRRLKDRDFPFSEKVKKRCLGQNLNLELID